MSAWRAGDMPTGKFIEFASEVGADAISILDAFFYEPGVVRDHLPSEEKIEAIIAETKAAMKATGIRMNAVAVTNDFNFDDNSRLRLEREKIRLGVRLAHEFDAPAVRVFSGNPTSSDGVELVRYRTIDALKDLSDPQVTLALENHGAVFATPSRLDSILGSIPNENVGLCFDIGNFILADVDPVQAAHDLPAPRLIHIKDFVPAEPGQYRSNSGKGYQGCRLGEGVVPLEACLKVLLEKSIGMPVRIDLEMECGDDGVEATRVGVQWLKDCLVKIG